MAFKSPVKVVATGNLGCTDQEKHPVAHRSASTPGFPTGRSNDRFQVVLVLLVLLVLVLLLFLWLHPVSAKVLKRPQSRAARDGCELFVFAEVRHTQAHRPAR
jgi:hypothetical protein